MEKKDKLLQIRITDSDYEDLKRKAETQGINVSELIRNSVNFISIQPNEEEKNKSSNYVKTCDASSILWAAKFIVNEFDIQSFIQEDKKEDLDSILLSLYNKQIFESLKKIALNSILHDLTFNADYKLDKDVEKTLKEIFVKYIGK